MSTDHITVWVVDYGRKFLMLQWKDPQTGKPKSASSKCTTRKKAIIAAAKKEEELNALRPKRDGSMSFEMFLETYMDNHLVSLSENAMKRARGILHVFQEMMDLQETMTLADITGSFLTAYAAKLRKSPIRKSKLKKKPTGSEPKKLTTEATIATHMRTIRAALAWACDNDYIDSVPPIPKQARARRTKAKGRPLTWPEVVKMLRATHLVVGKPRSRSWRRLIYGLYLSGLRLEESLLLTWSREGSHETDLWIDLSQRYPLLGIVAESEKGKTDRLLPLTPDFGRWLLRIPKEERQGFVFPLEKHRYADVRLMRSVSKVISQIGEKSGVVVSSSGKFASAHDLRRSFGLRWSSKVMPAELQALMRHASITTTMQYYAIQEATSFAERLWAAESADRTTPNTTPAKTAIDYKKQKP